MSDTVPQLKKNKNGGARPGAGRPKGSRNKLRVADFFSAEDKEQLVEEARQKAFVEKDKDMIKFLFEQLFGKATQKIAGDKDGDPLHVVHFTNEQLEGIFARRNKSSDTGS